jgi:hypothetical protein
VKVYLIGFCNSSGSRKREPVGSYLGQGSPGGAWTIEVRSYLFVDFVL